MVMLAQKDDDYDHGMRRHSIPSASSDLSGCSGCRMKIYQLQGCVKAMVCHLWVTAALLCKSYGCKTVSLFSEAPN